MISSTVWRGRSAGSASEKSSCGFPGRPCTESTPSSRRRTYYSTKTGRDSISTRKLEKGDARFKPEETMLGFDMHGHPKRRRTVGLNHDKSSRYRAKIQEALARKGHCLPFGEFRKIHGKVQHASIVMPCMKGFMTPLNRVLATEATFVGLGKGSEVRDTLADFDHLLALATAHPSHITEIVPPDLPHYYGYVDFAAVGMGGVWLPCTRGLQPLVWRARNPHDIEREVRKMNGTSTTTTASAPR